MQYFQHKNIALKVMIASVISGTTGIDINARLNNHQNLPLVLDPTPVIKLRILIEGMVSSSVVFWNSTLGPTQLN